ncbi:hypothetical protein FOA52_013193 [Chlamydomonas sp. UWO 241]|nr:hypothetical protein FOA52_013193 [Chlamydomonas sp. UWO 241]
MLDSYEGGGAAALASQQPGSSHQAGEHQAGVEGQQSDRQEQARQHLRELLRVFGTQVNGGVVPELVSLRFVHFYCKVLLPGDRPWFFRMVCSELGLDVAAVEAATRQWRAALEKSSGSQLQAEALHRSAERLGASTRPLYTQILVPIAQLEGGIDFLVRMRADLLEVTRAHPAFAGPLRALSEHLRQALAGWFSPGLLQLTTIGWGSAHGALLEKVMQYEAVHPMSGWQDLKRRLSPTDRRVYAFMHACLPGEPLVLLHTALSSTPPTSMAQLLPGHGSSDGGGGGVSSEGTAGGAGSSGGSLPPTVATFYSISSTQPGLSGVDLGHFLIKRAAEAVQAEFPSVRTLVTLSPVPNFRAWLMARLAYKAQQEALLAARAGGDSGGGVSGDGVGGGDGSGGGDSAASPLLSEADGASLAAAARALPPHAQQDSYALAGSRLVSSAPRK